MAGEAQDVDPERIHVDGNDARALGGVDDEDGSGFACDRPDGGEILNRSEDVRAMVDDHDPCPCVERIPDGVRIHIPLRVAPDPRDSYPAIALQVVERAQHGVVLDTRGDDMVASADEAEQRDVQRVGDVLGEHHPVGVAAEAEELREQAAGLEDHLLRLDGQGMPGPPRIDPMAAEEGVHEPVHRLGLRPRSGGVVEVVVVLHGGVLGSASRPMSTIAGGHGNRVTPDSAENPLSNVRIRSTPFACMTARCRQSRAESTGRSKAISRAVWTSLRCIGNTASTRSSSNAKASSIAARRSIATNRCSIS